MPVPHRIVRAWLEAPAAGIIELDRDWTGSEPPRFTLGWHCPAPQALQAAPGLPAGRLYGYYLDESGGVTFVLDLEMAAWIRRATRFIWRVISTVGRRRSARRSGGCRRRSWKARG